MKNKKNDEKHKTSNIKSLRASRIADGHRGRTTFFLVGQEFLGQIELAAGKAQ